MAQQLWHIKNCPLLHDLPEDEVRWLEARSRAREFKAKTPIYLPADTGNSVFVLTAGRAKICHLTPDGKQSILAFIEPGELFGEFALFAEGTRDEYAETLEKSHVVMIPGDDFRKVMTRNADLTMGISKLIGLRRRRIETRLKNLLFLSNRERLTHLLLELAEQYGVKVDGVVRLSIKLSHQDLASIIGSTRETVTVVLGELQSEGLVAVGRRRISLLAPKQLAASVQRDEPILPPPSTTPVGS